MQLMLQDKFRNKYLKERKGELVCLCVFVCVCERERGELRLNGEINEGVGTEKRAEMMGKKAEGFSMYL